MEVILIKTLQFFASLSLLIIIHEFGHYITARMFKIRVEKFYLFFNPWFTIYKRKWGETEYGIGWLPLGGYVSLAGMIDESMNLEQMKQEPQPWEFRSKPAWQRLIVMLAGIFMNVILAMFLYSMIMFTWGESYYHNDDVVYGYNFSERGEGYGFQDGDKIVSIDGQSIDNINYIREMLIVANDDRTVTVSHDGEQRDIVIPLSELVAMREDGSIMELMHINMPFVIDEVATDSARDAGIEVGDKVIAVDGIPAADFLQAKEMLEARANSTVAITAIRGVSDTITFNVPLDESGRMGVLTRGIVPRTREYGFFESIPAGISLAGDKIASYWQQLKMIFNPETKSYKEVGGFIAIGSIFPDTWNWYSFWSLTAFLSVVLAVMNILPIPGLDGGHALFTLWEIITRRKPSEKFLEIMQYIGFGLLILLLVYANANDIIRLFN